MRRQAAAQSRFQATGGPVRVPLSTFIPHPRAQGPAPCRPTPRERLDLQGIVRSLGDLMAARSIDPGGSTATRRGPTPAAPLREGEPSPGDPPVAEAIVTDQCHQEARKR